MNQTLEFAMPKARLHFVADVARLAYTAPAASIDQAPEHAEALYSLPECRLHFCPEPACLHYTLPYIPEP